MSNGSTSGERSQQQQQFNSGLVTSVPSSVIPAAAVTNSMNNSVGVTSMPGLLSPSSALEHYRLSQLYQYAMAAERLRCPPGTFLPPIPPGFRPELAPFLIGPYCRMDPRLALCRPPEEPKPQHSYIGLIAMAILSHPDKKLVLSDIYQYILDNYSYFRSRGPGWRNSIRHNLSLNDCFIKAGRSANGKGHYWAIHPANEDDFRKGDFRRRKAQRKVRRHMGLAVDDDDSPSPPSTSPPPTWHSPLHHPVTAHLQPHHPVAMALNSPVVEIPGMIFGRPTHPAVVLASSNNNKRKRQFDVASLLAPEKDPGESLSSALHAKESKDDDKEDSTMRKGFKKSSSETDEDEIEVCGNEVKSDEDEPRNFSHDTDTEEVSSTFPPHHHHHHRPSHRRHNHRHRASSRDGDESSSNEEESDDPNKISPPQSENRLSFPPKSSSPPDHETQKNNLVEESSCGPIPFSPMDFLGAHQLATQHGLGHSGLPGGPNPFQFPGHPHHHHLLQQNPSLASLMLLSSKYREITSNMVKRSPN